jgi:hypothetical protein
MRPTRRTALDNRARDPPIWRQVTVGRHAVRAVPERAFCHVAPTPAMLKIAGLLPVDLICMPLLVHHDGGGDCRDLLGKLVVRAITWPDVASGRCAGNGVRACGARRLGGQATAQADNGYGQAGHRSGPATAQKVSPDMALPPMTPTPWSVKMTPASVMRTPTPARMIVLMMAASFLARWMWPCVCRHPWDGLAVPRF